MARDQHNLPPENGKTDGHDISAFNQLEHSTVQTEQLECARLPDEELTERYLRDRDSKGGQ